MNLHIGGSGQRLSPSGRPCKSKTHAKRLRETADRLPLLQKGSERDRENCLDHRIKDRLKKGVLYLTFAVYHNSVFCYPVYRPALSKVQTVGRSQ